MEKRGQVTLLVIVGLVILIGAGLFFFISSSNQSTPEDITKELVDVGEEYRPVDIYVKSCLTSIGVQVAEQIGQHGGYLNPLEELTYDVSAPYDSDGILLTNSDESMVPYWVYIPSSTEQDTTIFPSIVIPELEDIERSHAQEIDKQLLSCLNNFDNLEFTGSEVEILKNSETTVTYTEKEIVVQTKLPVKVTLPDGSVHELEDFYSIIDIPFKKYYDMAKLVTAQEYENQYLENLLTTLISYYGSVDSSKIPPFYGIVQGYSFATWVQTDVRKKLQTLLMENIPLIQVQGTNNTYSLEDLAINDQDALFLNSLNLPLFYREYPSVEVNHYYLNWPIYSKVWPSEGELIKPKSLNYDVDIWHKAQDQTYNFFYDISYPVLVEIKEDDVYLGNSYVFMFAMEGNIRKNLDWRGYVNGAGPIDWDPKTDVVLGLNQEEEQFDAIMNKTYNVPSTSRKLFNEKTQFISQDISVRTVDYLSGLPLSDVDVQVGVGTYARAIIGSTEIKNGEAVFIGPGPIVKNGFVSLIKDGYLSQSQFVTLDNSTTTKDLGTVTLLPLKSKNTSLKVLEIVKVKIPNEPNIVEQVNQITTLEELEAFKRSQTIQDDDEIIIIEKIFERNLTEYESASLTIEYVPVTGSASKYSTFVQFNGNASLDSTVKLVPGRYTLQAMLFDNEGVVVPAFSKKICNGDDCDEIPEDKQYIPYEDIEMKPAIWGGIEFNSTMPWFISADDTYAENNITFYVIKFSKPETIDDLSKIGSLAQTSSTYRSMLLPELTYSTT